MRRFVLLPLIVFGVVLTLSIAELLRHALRSLVPSAVADNPVTRTALVCLSVGFATVALIALLSVALPWVVRWHRGGKPGHDGRSESGTVLLSRPEEHLEVASRDGTLLSSGDVTFEPEMRASRARLRMRLERKHA